MVPYSRLAADTRRCWYRGSFIVDNESNRGGLSVRAAVYIKIIASINESQDWYLCAVYEDIMVCMLCMKIS